MLSVGLDLHKRYSQVEALEESGERRSAARLVNEFEEIEDFFRALGEPCRVVLEAGWNWGSMYDWLERVENVVEVQLAHPYGSGAGSGSVFRCGVICVNRARSAPRNNRGSRLPLGGPGGTNRRPSSGMTKIVRSISSAWRTTAGSSAYWKRLQEDKWAGDARRRQSSSCAFRNSAGFQD
jgi:hypothetical protein